MKAFLYLFIIFFAASCNAQSKDSSRRDQKPPNPEQIIKDLDVNKDGKISKKEANGPLAKDFDAIDSNSDGYITLEELKKAPKPKRRERPRE